MKIETTRFGEVEISEGEILNFPEGILGFPGIHRYVLLQNVTGGPMQWLQAVEQPELAFIVCDPLVVTDEYKVKVRTEDLISIELEDIAKGFVMVILLVPDDVTQTTANLQGPLVINLDKRLAKQLVLPEGIYSTKHRIHQAA